MQATKSWGSFRVLVALQIMLALFSHRIECSCYKWIYSLFLFLFFFYKIILNLFQQAVWVIQFCYELTKIHHQPMTDLAFLSLQCKAWVQAAAAFISKVRHAKGKSSSTKIKTWPLFLQSRVTHQETHSLVTFLNEEPFIPLGRYVRSLEPDTLSSDLICSHRLIWSRLDQN